MKSDFHSTRSATSSESGPVKEMIPAGWESIALQSMSRLAEQFSLRLDFDRLLEQALTTLCDQFSVTDSFIALVSVHWPQPGDVAFAGTGRFKNEERFPQLIQEFDLSRLLYGRDVLILSETQAEGDAGEFVTGLQNLSVRVLVVLRAQERLVGFIGLGGNSDGKDLSAESLGLLHLLVKAITPIITNAHFFGEMNSLKGWYANILNNVRQGVFVFDRMFHLKMANLAGLHILESSTESEAENHKWAGRPVSQVFSDDRFPGWADRIEAMGIIADMEHPFQLVAKNAHGSNVYIIHIAGCSDWTSDDADVIVTVEDVTAQKENESRLIQLERLADKGMMSSAIAHELNNFLGLILGGIEVSLARVFKDDATTFQGRLEKLKEHAMTMRRFTSGLIDKHQLDTKFDLAQLNDIVSDVISFSQVQKRFNNIHILPRLHVGLPRVKIDINQISQLLLNFLNNAADAIREAKRDVGRITIRTELMPNQIQMSITDNGSGIDDAVKDKLFRDNFTTKTDGHGYGLTTCKTILDNHRAHVDVESTKGEGTTFRIRFPIDSAPAADSEL